jgi:transposase-like protein
MGERNRRPPRHFSGEQKLAILEEARRPGVVVAEVLRRHQLDAATFYHWEADARTAMREALGGKARGGEAALRDKEREIARLRAELEKKRQIIAEVVEENLALKGGL